LCDHHAAIYRRHLHNIEDLRLLAFHTGLKAWQNTTISQGIEPIGELEIRAQKPALSRRPFSLNIQEKLRHLESEYHQITSRRANDSTSVFQLSLDLLIYCQDFQTCAKSG
jgi:hypothetical protein